MSLDPNVKTALLKDPRVHAIVLQKGSKDALKDDEVQRTIVAVCRERFPSAVDEVEKQLPFWAQDPTIDPLGHTSMKGAGKMVLAKLIAAPKKVLSLIEQGPTGVRVLAFVAGLLSAAMSVLYLTGLVAQIHHPLNVFVDMYQLIFSLTTILFEAEPETIEKYAFVAKWDASARRWAPFLSSCMGRGLFLIFQGCLWIQESNLTEVLGWCVGVYMCFVGAVLVSLHCGVMPVEITNSIRQGAATTKRAVRASLIALASQDGGGDARQVGGGRGRGGVAQSGPRIVEVDGEVEMQAVGRNQGASSSSA